MITLGVVGVPASQISSFSQLQNELAIKKSSKKGLIFFIGCPTFILKTVLKDTETQRYTFNYLYIIFVKPNKAYSDVFANLKINSVMDSIFFVYWTSKLYPKL